MDVQNDNGTYVPWSTLIIYYIIIKISNFFYDGY
jgi:hypothetical protein